MPRLRPRAALVLSSLVVLALLSAAAVYLFLPWPEPVAPSAAQRSAEAETAAFFASLEASPAPGAGEPRRLEVAPGRSLQEVVADARPGDIVIVPPGVHHATVTLAAGMTLAAAGDGGPRPVLDGRGVLASGVVGASDDVTVRGLDFRGFTGPAVRLTDGARLRVEDVAVDGSRGHGIHVARAAGVDVLASRVDGARGAGLFVEQARRVRVVGNRVRASSAGVALENVVDGLVEGNEIYDNRSGILVLAMPGGASRLSRGVRVVGNRLYGNNRGPEEGLDGFLARVPPGSGVVIVAASEVEVRDNDIADQRSFGVLVAGPRSVAGWGREGVAQAPRSCRVSGNRLLDNGLDPAPGLAAAGLEGADLVWDLSGSGHEWDQPGATSSPPGLGVSDRLTPLMRARYRLERLSLALGGAR